VAIRQREALPADMAAHSAPDIEGRWPYKPEKKQMMVKDLKQLKNWDK